MTRNLSNDAVKTLRQAMLPMDGNISEHIPAIFRAFHGIVPRNEWPEWSFVDLTAGSCFLPLLFGAAGIGRLVVNDSAAHSALAARALFGGWKIAPAALAGALAAPQPALRRHTPSFHFAADYLTASAAEVFDRLFYARVPPGQRAVWQYLALRWAMGFGHAPHGELDILMTHDPDQLRRMKDRDWRFYVERDRRPRPVLAALARTVNAAIGSQRAGRVELYQEDAVALARRLRWNGRTLVMLNPPTDGIDEYVTGDQIVLSLIANRLLPLSMSRESPAAFWTRCVRGALRQVPAGACYAVWGGDGALRLRDCMAVWSDYGAPVRMRIGRVGNRRAGWAIFRRG